jgi:hypothetical protein
MARYTDIDKLIAEYDRVHVGPAGGARKLMVEAPIADVAPRTEVAREIFEEIEELFRQHKEGGYYLNGAWYPERLDLYMEDAFEELKNKYAEGEK